MLLNLTQYLAATTAELERRRALAAKEKPPAALPKPKQKQAVDNNRALNRWIRTRHWRAGVCEYTKCRGKNCPRKDI